MLHFEPLFWFLFTKFASGIIRPSSVYISLGAVIKLADLDIIAGFPHGVSFL